jgi:bifunctional non-homologous end joining protein LigD
MLVKTRAYEPMRPLSLKKGERWDFGKPGWAYQIKYDGFRGILRKSSEGCALESKEGNDLSRMRGSFDALCKAVAQELKAKDIVLDGEVVVLDDKGRADFWALMEARQPLAYAAFDILSAEGEDLRHLPLEARLMILRGQLPRTSGVLLYADTVEGGEDAARIFERLCSKELDMEGLVAKKLNSPYDPRLKDAWRKVLNPSYSHKERKQKFFNKARTARAAR